MRKALLLVVASAMVAGGLGLLFSEFFWATRIYFCPCSEALRSSPSAATLCGKTSLLLR